MIARWLSRDDIFLKAYLVMEVGCIYFLFNYIEGFSFAVKAAESILFRACWLLLYFVLLVKVASNAKVFLVRILSSTLLMLFLGLTAVSMIHNGTNQSAVLKLFMYLLTILFAVWVVISCPLERFVDALWEINIVVLIFHVLIYPIVGSAIDYDPLHRATILGTEAYAGVFGHKNLAGSFFGLMAVISLVRVLTHGGNRILPALSMMVLNLVALAAAGAVGPLISAFVTMAVVLGVYLVLIGDRGSASIYWLVIGFFLLAFLAVPIEELFELVGRSSGLTGRDFLWSAWPHFFWQRPLLGYGFAGFFGDVLDAPSVELTRMAPWNTQYNSFENSYLEAFLEFGLLGGVVSALIACRALWNSLRFVFHTTSKYWLAPFGLLAFTLISSINDNNLLLHNYFACVVLFWCYFGVEERSSETRPYNELSMRHV